MIDADPIAAATRAFMAARTEWTGTASGLLGALAEAAGERAAKSKTWPDSPRALAGRLRRVAPFLRKVGIEIDFGREGRARTRTIHIATTPSDATTESAEARPSTSSAPSTSTSKTNAAKELLEVHVRTQTNALPSAADANASATVRSIPLQNNAADDVDEADAKIPSQSALENSGTRGWRARL